MKIQFYKIFSDHEDTFIVGYKILWSIIIVVESNVSKIVWLLEDGCNQSHLCLELVTQA